MKTYSLLCAFSALAMFACGSGVDGAKKLSELTAEDAASLCEDTGATEAKDCGGVMIPARTVAECTTALDASTSNCTVDQSVACSDAAAGDPCLGLTAPECAALASCSGG